MTTIELDAPTDTTQVDDIPGGHQRVTPRSGGRYYLRRGDDDKHRSISGLPWPTDFAGATRYMAGKYVAGALGVGPDHEHVALIEQALRLGGGLGEGFERVHGGVVHGNHVTECSVTQSTEADRP